MTVYHPMRLARIGKVKMRRFEDLKHKFEPQVHRLKGLGLSAMETAQSLTTRVIQEEYGHLDRANIQIREEMSQRLDEHREMFRMAGSNIFDVSKLVPFLIDTEVEDVQIAHIPSPFPVFYIHFGEHEELQIPGSEHYIEGAYVLDGRSVHGPEDDAETGIGIILVCNHPNWDRVQDIRYGDTLVNVTRYGRTGLLNNKTVHQSLDHMEGFDGDPLVAECETATRAALQLLVNSMIYLSTPDADVESGFNDDAPAGLVEKALKGNRKANQNLINMGYPLVKIAGRKLIEAYERAGASGDLTPHWRRGHRHRVVVGKGRAGREWRWFMPVMVNAHKGPPREGRIYDVEDPTPRM